MLEKIYKYLSRKIRHYFKIFFYFRFKRVGRNCDISMQYVSLEGGKYITIGNSCSIMKNWRIEAIDKYCNVKFTPSIVIEDNVCINQNFHCTCASKITIGKGTSITANCGIFDINHPYKNIDINPRLSKIETKPIVIGDDCLIGMNSIILPGVELGNHVIVGANSTVLSGKYPSNCVLAGSPAKIIKLYNSKTKIWQKYHLKA